MYCPFASKEGKIHGIGTMVCFTIGSHEPQTVLGKFWVHNSICEMNEQKYSLLPGCVNYKYYFIMMENIDFTAEFKTCYVGSVQGDS